ncbi:SCO3242 family prenyltransferase [Streptomyces chartreusis]|uniref:SCO3242 family prenyltransferase n=1 Tax=Streptomyces chartreusis TaxID=1969 RepID=UPI003867FF8F|nr:UbiA family prenyltransferase [Streptomyces chartreusis]WTA31385.1 UbiA family prenyltransferase [Streptomyces chartreusis]
MSRSRSRAWAELLRLPALFTVPGDALSGAAAAGARPNSRTLLAIGSSLCLYEAGMALNDWADRAEDAAERPHRPLPSGRVHPAAAFTAACALTGAGLALAARAGRPALTVAAPLAATVWAYDLALKHTPCGPAAMATARALDLVLGAAATTGRTRGALPSAALLGTHTLAVTVVSRQETKGGSPLAPLAALTTTALLSRMLAHRPTGVPLDRPSDTGLGDADGEATVPSRRSVMSGSLPAIAEPAAAGRERPGPAHARRITPLRSADSDWSPRRALTTALAATYAATAARPYFHATLNPSPPLTQRAVGGGIRATIPLQAALSARSGAGLTALLIAGLAPLGRRFGRKVSVT